jgi:integrase
MAKRCKRGGWRRDGVKVREKVKRSGVWWVFVNHAVDGRLQRKSYCKGDRETADAFANELRAGFKLVEARQRGLKLEELERIGLAQASAPALPAITLATYAARFLAHNEPDERNPESLKQSTWTDYKQCLEGRIGKALGTQSLADIKRRDVRDLETTWRAEGLSSANIRKHVRVLSSVLSAAAADELIAVNPLLRSGKQKQRSKARAEAAVEHDHPFTREELATLLDKALSHRIERRGETVYPFRDAYPLLLCLAHSGIRLGEAAALRWKHLDWLGGFMRIERSYSHGVESVPKNGRARNVEVSDRLRAVLREVYRDRFERVVAIDAETEATLAEDRANRAAETLVFPDTIGGYLDDHNLRRRVWAPLLTAAGLSHHRLHDLRHTHATLHLQGGTDPTWVSQQLGHHSVAFTLTRYVKRPKNDTARYANRLDVTAPNCTPTAPDAFPTVADVADGGGLRESDSVVPHARAASSAG